MLALVLAAGLALSPRPPDLVKPGEEANYAAWLQDAARKAAGLFARADCSQAVVGSRDFRAAPRRGAAPAAAGPWIEVLSIDGCGVARTQSLQVSRGLADWRSLEMAPGDSAADLNLQRQALGKVILTVRAAAQADTACSDLDKARSAVVYDTRVTRPAALQGQPWSERWFMSVCGVDYGVDLDFTPAPDGGADIEARIAP